MEALGLLQMDRFVEAGRRRGRPAHNRANILRAFVAKAVFGMPHTLALLNRLQSDAVLRRICGWGKHARQRCPDETVFSRAFAEFAAAEAPQRVHAALIERSWPEQLVGHISREFQRLDSRSRRKDRSRRAKEKPKRQTRASRRKQEQDAGTDDPGSSVRSLPETTLEQIMADLPRLCDKGCKNDSKGLPQITGSATNCTLDVADGQVAGQLRALTSASLHDSQSCHSAGAADGSQPSHQSLRP